VPQTSCCGHWQVERTFVGGRRIPLVSKNTDYFDEYSVQSIFNFDTVGVSFQTSKKVLLKVLKETS
jgi:hypothetical protein